MKKTIEQTYQVLDEIDHIRKRTGMYAGSVVSQTSNEWVYDTASKKMVKKNLVYIPALIKIFSELLDNAIDESRRANELDSIRVSFDGDTISVHDNGRGIPVVVHAQTGKYIAETVFSNLRAGSNFNDDEDQQLIGTNGVGSTLTNVLSSTFKIESADGVNLFSQVFTEGMRKRTEPSIKPYNKKFTKITFTPDYKFFGLDGLTPDIKEKMIKKVVDAAACNTAVKFYVDGDRLNVKSFSDYVGLYCDDFVEESTDSWSVALSASDGFEQISFVNSVETYQGGTHVDYVMLQITDAIRAHIKKKHKVEVKPSDVRNHVRVYISANVNRPRFSSQTKENMISPVAEYKTSWSASDKFIRKIVSGTVIQTILDWVMAKERAAEAAELRKKSKDIDRANLRKITKFTDASEKTDRDNCMLLLCEGDSAANSVLSARNQYTGCYALKGKPINALAATTADVLDNKEFVDLMKVTGLKIGEKITKLSDCRFGKICVCADADSDGNHITGLVIAMFRKYWPELFELGMIYRFRTPIMKAIIGQKEEFFYSLSEFDKWAKTEKRSFKTRYLKGLGSSTAQDFRKYFQDMENNLIQIKINDVTDLEIVDMVFGKEAGSSDRRKEWLDLE